MSQGLRINDDVRDNIILLKESGLTGAKIAEILGLSASTITATLQCDAAAKEKNYDELRKNYGRNNTAPVVWAAKKYGLNLEDVLHEKAAPAAAPAEPKTTDNTAQAFVVLLDAVKAQTEAIKELTKTVSEIDTQLSQLRLVVSGFRGDVGEKIKSVIESIHYEGSALDKTLTKANDHLGGIKSNTRKRPWQEGEG